MGTMTETARVLYVDDDPSFADMISTMLEREADFLTIETAETAERGLEFIRTETVDCVVSDYSMPETDGFEVAERIRANDNWREIPTVVITAMDIDKRQRARLEETVEAIYGKGQRSMTQIVDEVVGLITASSADA